SFDALNPEDRGVPKCSSIIAYSKAVIAQLIKGPNQKGLFRTIPPAASLRAVYLYGETLVVDFSKDLVNQHPGGVSSELLSVYSIVNTLMELPPVDGKSIKNVQILINGYPMKTLIGHVNIEKPLTAESGLVSSI
ncbi:MAG TPA: GerMN domain-containing protein, partial [Candidatus Wallbacteria bacterium]|nr:GerMN domain-containing protein [Candidatus Wallbacteria bacterium]